MNFQDNNCSGCGALESNQVSSGYEPDGLPSSSPAIKWKLSAKASRLINTKLSDSHLVIASIKACRPWICSQYFLNHTIAVSYNDYLLKPGKVLDNFHLMTKGCGSECIFPTIKTYQLDAARCRP